MDQQPTYTADEVFEMMGDYILRNDKEAFLILFTILSDENERYNTEDIRMMAKGTNLSTRLMKIPSKELKHW